MGNQALDNGYMYKTTASEQDLQNIDWKTWKLSQLRCMEKIVGKFDDEEGRQDRDAWATWTQLHLQLGRMEEMCKSVNSLNI